MAPALPLLETSVQPTSAPGCDPMTFAYISLDFPTLPTPLMRSVVHRSLTQRLSEDAAFLQVYLRDGLNVLEPFRTQERYAGLLTVQYHMLVDLQRYNAAGDLRYVVGDLGLSDPARSRRMEADLRDLDAWPVKPVPPAPAGLTLLETLGWVYASEGLMLSLERLAHAKDVGALLGLTEQHGGRHLHAPIGARTQAWRRLAQTLDSGALSDEKGTVVVAAACLAYQRLDQLLSLALGKLE
jgi:heme oxygenase (biliverdin-IX-beta and delta-forming)